MANAKRNVTGTQLSPLSDPFGQELLLLTLINAALVLFRGGLGKNVQTCSKKEKLDKTGKKINEFIKVY